MQIIIGKQGNQRMPITDPTVSRKHCKVTPNGDGTYTVENLSQTSFTKVDGKEIIRAKATLNSRLQLGPIFSATLVELIGRPVADGPAKPQGAPVATKPTPQPPVKTYNISHLNRVWDDFNQTNLDLAEKQRKVNLVRTGSMVFTMSAALVASFTAGPIGWIFTGIGIFGNLYSFIGVKNAESPEEKQRRMEAFDDAWICPNPECGKSLPAKNYKNLLRNFQSCPYCKCKYVAR